MINKDSWTIRNDNDYYWNSAISPKVADTTLKGPFWSLRVLPQASVVKAVIVLLEPQTQQVFFPHGSYLPVSLVLGNAAE